MLTVKQALLRADELEVCSPSARLDTEILLAFALQKPRTFLYTWPEQELLPEEAEVFAQSMQRRLLGEPVAYIAGRRAFWNFDLRVNPNVLIPRPETELLVELALSFLGERDSVADLGTGSGAIALALASERPACQVIAVDRSAEALAVSRTNAFELGLHNIEFRSGDWCAGLPPQKFHMIVSNPPYIDAEDPHLQSGDLRFEPTSALIAGDHGLADIETICRQAKDYLYTNGVLLLEHGYNQAAAVREILQNNQYSDIKSCQDIAGHLRVTMASFSGA